MSRDYWEKRYQTGDTSWEKGAPSPGLVDFLAAHPELPRGTVCVPGCGTGHDARAWAAAGFDAVGLDLAPSAIALARERTRAAGLAARFHLVDFLQAGRAFAVRAGDMNEAKPALRIARHGGELERVLQPELGPEPAESIQKLHGAAVTGVGLGGGHPGKEFRRCPINRRHGVARASVSQALGPPESLLRGIR